jgi:predicted ribosome quality control (RQC) complex YloA/Tae2 family protein
MASKGRPYRTLEIEGYEVLIGRADTDNDVLTFRVANARDLWLHVGGATPGSHVVVRHQGHDFPRDVIERAAELAAFYSKAASARRVEVHYCPVSAVRKPRGAPAGLVELARFERIRVAPRGPDSP